MSSTFQHEGHYVCECGREFTKAQSYNAHLSHCREHLSEDRYEKRLEHQRLCLQKGLETQHEQKLARDTDKIIKWQSEDHYCEKCGKKLPSDFKKVFGTGRFCSVSCANSHEQSLETRLLISKNSYEGMMRSARYIKYRTDYENNKPTCIICGKELSYDDKNKKTCSDECLHKLRVLNGIKSSESLRHTYCARSGYYKGIFMASSWELAFYVWHELHNLSIRRNKDHFDYMYNNSSRAYLPDFVIGDDYIEIKGRGKWFIEDEVDKKISSCNAKIYYIEDLKEMFNEVCLHYGVKNTIELCELLYEPKK